MSANRRDFIKFVVAGAVTAGCPIDLSLVAQTGDPQKNHGADVEGEDNRICHQVRDGKVFVRPPASARHDVVIVGGGVSGLSAAYRLQHRDFLLLEKEAHWGGNAYAMEYEGSMYATGSAFLAKDEYAYRFAKEIGLEPLPVNSPDASILRGELILDTWATASISCLILRWFARVSRNSKKRCWPLMWRNAVKNLTTSRFPIS